MRDKINHICPKCDQYIHSSIQKHINSCDGRGPRRKIKRGKRGGWNKGKTYEELLGKEKAEIYINLIKEATIRSYKEGNRAEVKDENNRREKISLKMKKVGGGYRIGSGRGKKGRYKGIWCDSSWELAWIIYHLDNNIDFERNTEYFEYTYLNETHKYLPDFKIGNKYVEIKGYLTEQTICKINSFKGQLEIVDKFKIKFYLKYVIDKYGKDFIRLYEEKEE